MSTSNVNVQGDLIVHFNVPNTYPPSQDVEVRFKIKGEVTTTSRDWLGLFRVGWTSSREYYTFEWVPALAKGEELKVVFSGRRLPSDDGQSYQFCYFSRDSVLFGSSTPFRFTKTVEDRTADEKKPEESIVVIGLPTCETETASGKPLPDADSNSLMVIESLKNELHRSFERQLAAEAQSEELRQQSDSIKVALISKEMEMQVTREQMEDLIKKLSAKIDLLEERLLEKQSVCVTEMELRSQQLAFENSRLNEKLCRCIDEVQVLKGKLGFEETLRRKSEQQLLAVEGHTQTSKCSAVIQGKDVHTEEIDGRAVPVADSTKSSNCSTSDVDRNAMEALQIAYGTIEKYYHASCAELDACQVSLHEAQTKVKMLEQRCIELEEQISSHSKAIALEQTTTKPAPSSSDTLHMKQVEQQTQESEDKSAIMLASQAADREEQYKIKIKELECQLVEHKKSSNVMNAECTGEFESAVNPKYDGILQQMKELIRRLKSKETGGDMPGGLLEELEKVILKINNSDTAEEGTVHSKDMLPEAAVAGIRQCPVCQLEFPQSMPQKNFERHVRRHLTSGNI